MKTLRKLYCNFGWLLIILAISLAACNASPATTEGAEPEPATPKPTQVVSGESAPTSTIVTPTSTLPLPMAPLPGKAVPIFASYEEPVVNLGPAWSYETAASDLSNVVNSFALSQEQIDRLAKDGFVVSPGADREFFTLYESARYNNLPVFVTSDSLLHVYHLLFDKVLRTAETEHFIPMLRDLNAALLAKADDQYQALKDSPWQDAALRTVAYVGVASKLLDPTIQVPDYVVDLTQAEIAQIEAASGILPSPIFPGLENGEDYTQYIPRGHYTRSDALKAYFKSMMWYGRMTFRLKASESEVGKAETRSAILLVNALKNTQVNDRPALDAWADLYSPTVFFVGRSDDLTVLQYLDVIDAVYGSNPSLDMLTDETKLDQFIEQAMLLPPPRILGIVIYDTDDEVQLTKGLRFMGQRFVPDAYIFRQLMYRNVGTPDNRRGLPKGLDIPAAMGSERAYQILDQMGETKYKNYPQQMEKMRNWLNGLNVSDWTETLYNAWLYTFYPLLEVPGDAYPKFMQSPAWVDKQLNTVLGSWTELKHDTILYAKQAYAELGGGPPPPPPLPPKGYVEPVPYFYARLQALTAMTRTGLSDRGLLSEQDARSLQSLEQMAASFQTMAEKELRGEPLTDNEYEVIRYYGGDLENLTMAAADTADTEDPYSPKFLDEDQQVPLIADVATDPSPELALEEAVGWVYPIYVVTPIVNNDGSTYLQVAKGGVFSQYEFTWPISDRLTDEKWRSMLDSGQAPPLADWMNSFLVQQGEYTGLTYAVYQFQQTVINSYWSIGYGGYFDDPGLKSYQQELQQMQSANQYMGHQLIQSTFRSFDLQSENKAVVTVRETWQDKLYQFSGDYADYEEQPIGERGPYVLDVTYTLDYDTEFNYWRVTNAVYANQAPSW